MVSPKALVSVCFVYTYVLMCVHVTVNACLDLCAYTIKVHLYTCEKIIRSDFQKSGLSTNLCDFYLCIFVSQVSLIKTMDDYGPDYELR